MGKYTICKEPGLLEVCLEQARGTYQRDLIHGHEAWSGATLAGKARSYGGRYARSRSVLLERLEAAGIDCHFETIQRRKTLVVEGVRK